MTLNRKGFGGHRPPLQPIGSHLQGVRGMSSLGKETRGHSPRGAGVRQSGWCDPPPLPLLSQDGAGGFPSCFRRGSGGGQIDLSTMIIGCTHPPDSFLRGYQAMATILRPAPDTHPRRWECKHCHQPISDAETVAYHLISGILYGWCEACFRRQDQGTGLSPATQVGHCRPIETPNRTGC
jgi:hypothetical protein